MKTKILFFNFDLGNGGAEKVLINLLKCLDYQKYDVTLYLLFNAKQTVLNCSKNSPVKLTLHTSLSLDTNAMLKILYKDRHKIIDYITEYPNIIIILDMKKSQELINWDDIKRYNIITIR